MIKNLEKKMDKKALDKALDPMSHEQRHVYNLISEGNNVVVDACAGSGKSTTILSIADAIQNIEFIQLTYNSVLCGEIRQKIRELAIQNLHVYTFHSLVVKYYSTEGHTDTFMRRVVKDNMVPRTKIPKFQVLVIDEAQDMSFLYFKMVVKFCKDAGNVVQLLILGDYMQGLYEFKGSDVRFLTQADEIWKHFPLLRSPDFVKCTLKTSYRVTQPMADFVNNVLLGDERLLACKSGEPVVYIRRKIWEVEKYIIHKILGLIRDEGAKPSDFFVLGGSVKGEKSAIRRLENVLVEKNIPCHVPMFENDKIDERVIDGKVVFSTFHSVKGRQRKYVFITGFDKSYFTYFARNLSPLSCPNTLYVGATRATHRLFLVENEGDNSRPLPFLKMNHVQMKNEPYMDFQGIPQSIFYKNNQMEDSNPNIRIRNGRKLPTHMTTPTELIKFVSESVIEEINPILDCIFVRKHSNISCNIDIPSVIHTRMGFHEDVSDLNGIAIPMMYFEKLIDCYNGFAEQNSVLNGDFVPTNEVGHNKILQNPMSSAPPNMNILCNDGGQVLHNIIRNNMSDVKEREHVFLKKHIEGLPTICNSISDYLSLSNTYVAVKEKLYFKIHQIKSDEYTWLSEDTVNACFARIHGILRDECILNESFSGELEQTIIRQSDDLIHRKIDDFLCEFFPDELFRFTARVDLTTDFCVWELKCTTTITNEHLLQVVIYAWIWRMVVEDIENLENIRDFKIFNIKTGELLVLDATTEQLNDIMLHLLKGKYGKKEQKKDVDFVSECHNYISLL